MLVDFHGMKLELPAGWSDVTDDLPVGGPPSLSRADGVGAIQFTFAKYRSGEEPNVTIAALRNFLLDFFERNKISLDRVVEKPGHVISIEGVSDSERHFILARYFSNGRDVALATYTCLETSSIEMQEDLKGVEIIMNSMKF